MFRLKMPPPAFLIKLFLILSLAGTLLLLSPQLISQIKSSTGNLANDFHLLMTTTLDERKLKTYGDKTIMGYGYLLKIARDIPESHIFPLVRYSYYGMNARIVFPGNRSIIDKRILVGIDLLPEDLIETNVARAVIFTKDSLGHGYLTGWVFLTNWDYDRITGLTLHFRKSEARGTQHIKAVIRHSPDDRTRLGAWVWPSIEIKKTVALTMDKPLSEIYSRGSLPFLLFIENLSADSGKVPEISAVDVRGIKVDTAGYTLVHRDGNCFTAIQTSFLTEILADGPAVWRTYVESITNIPGALDLPANGKTPEGKING